MLICHKTQPNPSFHSLLPLCFFFFLFHFSSVFSLLPYLSLSLSLNSFSDFLPLFLPDLALPFLFLSFFSSTFIFTFLRSHHYYRANEFDTYRLSSDGLPVLDLVNTFKHLIKQKEKKNNKNKNKKQKQHQKQTNKNKKRKIKQNKTKQTNKPTNI